jgi:hypothetical protein
MRKALVAVFAVLVLGAVMSIGPSANASPPKHAGPKPLTAGTCFKTFQSGTGNSFFRWCITKEGEVNLLESPVTFVHLNDRIEGYAVCQPGFNALSNNNTTTNWGPATFTAPNKITRNTTNGRFRLVQIFTQDAPNRRIVIKATLTNTSGSSQANIRLGRLFDGDIDNNSSGDIYVRTQASVIGTDQHGLQLIGTTFNQAHVTELETFSDILDDTGCSASTPLPSPTTAGDNSGRFTYNVGALGPNQAKTLTFEYRLI